MEILTGCTANLVSGVAKFMFQKIRLPISYVFHHKRRVVNFDKKVETSLKASRDRVQHLVTAAEHNTEKIETDVQDWLIKVNNIINEKAKKVKDLEDKAKNKCFIGLCPNFKSRYLVSKKAEEDASEVDKLLLQADGFDKVSYQELPQINLSPRDFEAFDSRKQVFNEIMEAIKDPSISIIGVHGMGGVGKTTLIKEVAGQLQKDKLFISVVMASVSYSPDIQKIQDRIAEILGLKLVEKDVVVRASRLQERLKIEKKILVVLDDIWARLDLNEVGVPFGDEHQGCTIVLTSRDVDVLNRMDAQKTFSIGVLEQKEVWDLFKKMAGKNVESRNFQNIANEIAKRCAGLPIAISTVARTLRDKPLFEWKDALRQLKKPSSSNFKGVPADAYSAIELSYNGLQSEEHKQTFLLCSLLGHNVSIQDLLKYAMGLGLFHGVSTVADTRDRLLTVVSHLKASSLLLDSYTNERVDMHDLICDVAVSIASKDNRAFVLRHDDVLNDWPDEETMKRCAKIRLQSVSISRLPDQLKCRELTFFYITNKDPSMKIPTNFFKETRNLKVLDLTKMHFPSLPSSICLLANLRTLCLDQCELRDIAIIGELKNLETLSLLHSAIEMLPKEIGQLVRLKLLDLTGCTKLKTIPPGVLSSLSSLEELYMGNSFVQWEAGGHTSQRSNASLAELKALSCLTTLDIHIPNAKIIPKDLSFEKLQRYKIFIGEAWDWAGKIEYSRTLKLKLHTSIGFLNRGMKMLLKKAENLYLDEMEGVESLLHESESRECFQELKNLHIQNGALIQYIIKDNGVVDKIEFLELESLTLQDLPKLISFCSEDNGSTSISPQGLPLFDEKIVFPKLEKLKLSSINIERIWSWSYSIQNLTSFIIEGCGNLKHVLSYSMAQCLHQLKYLEITECKCLQDIISTEEIIKEEHGKRALISFPRLNSLKLKGLQKLIGFCHEGYIVEFPSLEILEIEQCPELKGFINKLMSKDISTGGTEMLFNEEVAFPNLEKMIISQLRSVKRLWYNELHTYSFCKLKELRVEYCDELLNIFSSFVLGVFRRLEILTVTDCTSLEEVFELQVQGLDIEETCVMASQLRQLYTYRLPKLKHVWNKDPHGIISFQNLRQVNVWECWSLKSLFPFSIAKGLLQLESLSISQCGVEEIVSKNIEGVEQDIWFEFNQLSFLNLWNLPNLKCFYSGMHSIEWPMLKKLKTYWCGKIKIFGRVESQIQQSLFLIEKIIPQLEEVSFNSDDIAMIYDGQFVADLFCHIKVLRVTNYLNESAVFPFCFLQRFNNLEMLEMVSCNFKELSLCEDDVGEEKDDVGEEKDVICTLPKIKKLKLNGVNEIRHLWKQDSLLDHVCASLEILEVWDCDSLINIGPSFATFQNLTILDVWKCKDIAELITSSKARNLECLVTMRIRECEMMREVVASEGDEATYEIVFRELKCLELHCLQSLRSFCSGNYNFKFPSLEQVILSQCPRLKSFNQGALSTPKLQKVQLTKSDHKGHWASELNTTVEQLYIEQVGCRGLKHLKFSEFPELMDIWNRNPQEILDFKNLEFLEVCNSNNLRCIFNLSMALSLVRLKKMEIKRCNKLELVIKETEGSVLEEATSDNKIIIIFPRLDSIIIESCPDMTSFYLGSSPLECPSLQRLEVADCPKMTTFVSTFSRDDDKEAIIGDGTDNVTAFFCDKVAFPNLEQMIISQLRSVKRLWYNQLHTNSFCKLKELKVEYCDELLNIFSTFVLGIFQRLEILTVIDCASLEEVFELQVQGLDVEETCMMASQLRELYTYRLPKLKHVWNKDPHEIISFQNLRQVDVFECWSLKSLFPFSIAKGLLQLESLVIDRCGVEEIVSKNIEGVEQDIWFEFNQLSLLTLWRLPNLKRFYPEMHSTEWPVLKELRTDWCEKIKIFGRVESQIQQPLFLIEKIIPQLEEVSFSSDDIAMICDGQFATDLFCHIKLLRVTSYLNESAVFPFCFLQRFNNLEILEMVSCNFKELSFYEDDAGEEKDVISTLPTIKKLKLLRLNKIRHLWKKDSPLDHICASLETLEVWRCDSLINIGASSISFQNLTTLDVWECKEIAELITSSKAQNLERLVTMTIRECEMMREVVASEGEEATYEIVFRELKCLELHCLQSLGSFCSGNYNFKFPSLEQVILSQCPRLKSFSQGALSTPKLQKVQLTKTDYKGRWAGELNTTVEQLYIEQVLTEIS
ncbi:hypothetical protein REPUB_Repub04eG0240900 [Reevesia pubescens]